MNKLVSMESGFLEMHIYSELKTQMETVQDLFQNI